MVTLILDEMNEHPAKNTLQLFFGEASSICGKLASF
jgi:hypothetical protein